MVCPGIERRQHNCNPPSFSSSLKHAQNQLKRQECQAIFEQQECRAIFESGRTVHDHERAHLCLWCAWVSDMFALNGVSQLFACQPRKRPMIFCVLSSKSARSKTSFQVLNGKGIHGCQSCERKEILLHLFRANCNEVAVDWCHAWHAFQAHTAFWAACHRHGCVVCPLRCSRMEHAHAFTTTKEQ
eukprot:1156352-Pelagomonas_calceolata.AAC.9